METVDEHVVRRLREWREQPAAAEPYADPTACAADAGPLQEVLTAQLTSRHLDLAARWLQQQGEGFYTISSAGHESNAALALALRPTDPALLHYRSGGFYVARAGQVPGSTPVRDVLAGVAASTTEPVSGGRHKVFGHHALSVLPQTSTIGSHLPRAFGLAFSLDRARALGLTTPWPDDALVVASFGDASANHSTTVGALNAAAYCTRRGVPVPLLLVCEDNGLGISVPTPAGWLEESLARWPGIDLVSADGTRPAEVLHRVAEAAALVRGERRPVLVHLRTVRFLGHAGSDVELGYRSRGDVLRDYDRDPLLATAATLLRLGAVDVDGLLEQYESTRASVLAEAATFVGTPRLADAATVMAPLTDRRPGQVSEALRGMRGSGPGQPLTLAQSINTALADVLASWPSALVLGEDVATKGGVYGVTRGLRKRFGGLRVFDTLLDEQTILGTALGAAVAGMLPIPEIQYLAYVHNAEDQLRGEAASLAFFAGGEQGRYRNGMVVRIAGFAHPQGFGGHFHNDSSLAVLRDVPGLVVAVPSHPADAPALLRACVALAVAEGRVCVFVEPIALYHQRDLHDGDGRWLASYEPGDEEVVGRVATHGDGADLLLVTFGTGVRTSMLAADRLAELGIGCTVLDLRWLAPLPYDDLMRQARRFDHLLVVDETRASGGVSEGVLAGLVDADYRGRARRVAGRDSFVPLGPAAAHVLVSVDDVVDAATEMLAPRDDSTTVASSPGRHVRRTPTEEAPMTDPNPDVAARARAILERVGAGDPFDEQGDLACRTPVDGSEIGRLRSHTVDDVAEVVGRARAAFEEWRSVPAPVRGGLVRELGLLLREHKDDLGALVTIEAGKIASEGLGEVQEMVDICDLAVGLSRQLHGLTIASERPDHRMMEQWHPLGVVGVISAFNFPVAVWSWNAALALVCGDAVVWKPSEKTPLTALACQALTAEAARRVGAPEHLTSVLLGDSAVGTALVDDPRVALVSATGSTRMGKAVAPRVAARLGRVLLELGGNNAAIVTPSADLDLAVRGIVFSAVGTAGQRCTSLRRVIAHSSVRDELVDRLRKAYDTLPIGSPLDASTLVGPLIDDASRDVFAAAVEQAVADGGTLVTGGEDAPVEGGGSYVRPAIVVMPAQTDIVRTETFAPLLHVLTYDDLDEAIALHNEVAQGLSSSIFTTDLREAERFVSATGSDCGIANVNLGPSGAEIGGAFGGEKETGGGRESGSDAWKSYMRRATNTVNYGHDLPLAQGVEFL